ncbi:hypothetical protein M422DRAFT_25305 [Sphaerobolus stellatus SS14]|nr:hypothetical protein M422DRAFT_25305 [Sphaerobolus stellatus SS14]
MNVHSVSAELATVARKTRGTVPPKLVGASTTVVGDKMYLFGGRLVVERRMLSELYVFDMQTYTWDKLEPSEDSVIPGPRYFHSADSWNNHLVIFGGMGYQTSDHTQETLCVLNDVSFFSIAESRWLTPDEAPASPLPPQSFIPRARYAHLSAVSSDMLFIIGGQDLANGWMDDIHVYDLPARKWVNRSDYPRHCGTYRSVALSSPLKVWDPTTEPPTAPGSRFRPENAPSIIPVTSPDSFVELPYSVPATPNSPSEIFLYSNYNFTDVKRELEVFTPQPPASFSIVDKSDSMTGAALPPGLRFPTGALLGNSLIIAGTYLAHSYQAFSIWSLDLTTMTWSRIEPGTALASGSWCRAVLWRESNKFLVFGNREGNLVEDYNHRLLSWDHVAYIDLEAFGIYQPPIEEDDDAYDLELLGLDSSYLPEEHFSWTPSLSHRISHNTRPSLSRSSSSGILQDNEDYFGTEPDQSPLTSSFSHIEKPQVAFHLPYSRAHRPSGSASFSDAPSLEDTRSYGTISTQSSAPVTPLSPALADIVDAVSKVTVSTNTSTSLSRQTSLRSVREPLVADDRPSFESQDHTSLSNFPLPPLQDSSKLLKITTSLSNVSEQEITPSWLHDNKIDNGFNLLSPETSISSFEYTSTPSLSRKSSYDMLGERSTPVPQSPGGSFSRFLRSRRSSSTLDNETLKARPKPEKLEIKIEERGDRTRAKSLSEKDRPFGLLSGLLSPRGPKTQKAEEKRKKKELERQLEKQNLRDVVVESKARAARANHPKLAPSGQDWVLARVAGL